MKKESHGWHGTRLYTAWTNMKGRCYRKSMKGYQNNGAYKGYMWKIERYGDVN